MSASEDPRLTPLRDSTRQLYSTLQAMLAGLDADTRSAFGEDFDKCLHASTQACTLLTGNWPESDQVFIHDLRNYLGAVRGYAELIGEEAGDQGNANLTRLLAPLREMADAALSILDPMHLTAAASGEDLPLSAFTDGADSITVGRLLVIDDDDASRELLIRHLLRHGHDVISAASGQEALNELARQDVDLIFLDLVMPEMSGLELLLRIKADDKLRAIPVIIVSGIQDTDGVIRCIEAGADDYLYKPFNQILLHARLRAGLQRKDWHDREQEYRRELERNQRFIRNTFGRYLSDEIVDALLESPQGLNLGGTTTRVTILMADIRNFTTISEQLDPERVVSLLNNYLGFMSDIIMNNHGTVDEFIGDGILAIFGAPVNRDDDAARAIACAIDMQSAVGDINARNKALQLPEIGIGIGLNTGLVVAGNIGSEKRSKYGVVGHPVNLTARIESYTRGGEILASAATVRAAAVAVGTGRQFDVQPKGMAEQINVLEIMSIGAPYDRRLPPRLADGSE